MASKLRPGKGAHLHLSGDTLGFFTLALSEVYDVLCKEGTRDLNEALDEMGAEALFKELKESVMDTEAETPQHWHYVSDNFGKKLYTSMVWKSGEYRLTVVLTDNGDLKLDVREWYNPEA
jgi:hypothetical protein